MEVIAAGRKAANGPNGMEAADRVAITWAVACPSFAAALAASAASAAATIVTVTAGGTVSGIDASMAGA